MPHGVLVNRWCTSVLCSSFGIHLRPGGVSSRRSLRDFGQSNAIWVGFQRAPASVGQGNCESRTKD